MAGPNLAEMVYADGRVKVLPMQDGSGYIVYDERAPLGRRTAAGPFPFADDANDAARELAAVGPRR
jgi:hypothetical protein